MRNIVDLRKRVKSEAYAIAVRGPSAHRRHIRPLGCSGLEPRYNVVGYNPIYQGTGLVCHQRHYILRSPGFPRCHRETDRSNENRRKRRKKKCLIAARLISYPWLNLSFFNHTRTGGQLEGRPVTDTRRKIKGYEDTYVEEKENKK